MNKISRCPKCEGFNFEMVEKDNIKNSQFKIMFIQCQSCNTVVGTTDYYNTGILVKELAKKLRIDI
jgi:hypothetical protein